MATTDAHVVCSVCQCCRPPSIALGASWSPSVLRTHNLCQEGGGVGALQGADIARAEGYMVHDAPGADAPHSNDILGQEADEL